MFDKMKALMDMRKMMQEVKQQLENTAFEIESSDGLVKITMNGSQEVKEVKINAHSQDQLALEKAFKDTFNRAVKHSQEIAAGKMKDATGLNLSGLL